MTLTRDRISALVFIALSIGYLFATGDIELYPGEEERTFNPRTFPRFVGYLALIVSVLLLVLPSKGEQEEIDWRGFAWWPVIGLCIAMVIYGLTISSVGFFLSTSLFLLVGFLILGERRWKVLLLSSIPLAGGMEYILIGLLDIYIEDPALEALGVISW